MIFKNNRVKIQSKVFDYRVVNFGVCVCVEGEEGVTMLLNGNLLGRFAIT